MEKIIIDGVDVAGCKHITKAREVGDQYCALYDYNYCIGKMCEYKQLKRLEQENEELKNILKDIDKKLELALDVEQTSAEESFDLLYEIQDIIAEAIGE